MKISHTFTFLVFQRGFGTKFKQASNMNLSAVTKLYLEKLGTRLVMHCDQFGLHHCILVFLNLRFMVCSRDMAPDVN
jgi:hypothetical protein